jgi:hypothetical protein
VQSGTKTASNNAVQPSVAVTGCSSGHAPLVGVVGLPNSCLVAAATALTGMTNNPGTRIVVDGCVLAR